MGPKFIHFMELKQEKGQPIRVDGPQSHILTKKGTPTVKCLVRSSNRCMAQIAQLVGRSKQKTFLQDVGLLDEYFLEIFETGSPILPDKWTNNSMITISFGQGLGVVPLSFASGIASIINGGYKIKLAGLVLTTQSVFKRISLFS